MGRQFRATRRGSGANGDVFVMPQSLPSTAAFQICIPNYGITDCSTMGAAEVVMDPPSVGVRKTLVRVSTGGSTGFTVRFSTSNTVSCGTWGTTAGTQVKFDSTKSCCLSLIGLNSTHWIVESCYTGLVNAGDSGSTGIVISGT